MLNKKYFRVKRDSGKVFEFSSINPEISENLDENGEVLKPENSDHSYWVEYEESFVDYVEQSIQKARWEFSVNGVGYGNLETLKIGSIYKKNISRLLPDVDFGTINPSWVIFDIESNEWMFPTFDTDGIKIWDAGKKEYTPLVSE